MVPNKIDILAYGVRSVKSMRKLPEKKEQKIIKDLEKYFTKNIDHVISRCITYVLCVKPVNTIEALHVMKEYFEIVKAQGSVTYKTSISKPRHDQKLLLASIVGPIISKLVNRMIFLKPENPIDYFLQEITIMIELYQTNDDKNQNDISVNVDNQTELFQHNDKLRLRPESAPAVNHYISVEKKAAVKQRPVSAFDSDTSKAVENVSPQLVADSVPIVKRKKLQIGMFGAGSSGKTSILNSIQGEVSKISKPTVGFRPVALELDSNTEICFYDLGGSPKIRDIWPQYYHDIHGIVFVFDLSIAFDSTDFEETKQLFKKVISDDKTIGKPILILANKYDLNQCKGNELYEALELATTSDTKIFAIDCCGIGINGEREIPDDRIETGLQWLISSIQEEFDSLNARVLRDTALRAEEDLKKKLLRERKVLKNKISSAFYKEIEESLRPPDVFENEDMFNEAEGLEFLASEIGEDLNSLPLIARQIAELVRYQRLALQIIGNLKSPISKTKVAMTWDQILIFVEEIRAELGLNA